MQYQLAQLNIARFRKPMEDPVNADFINNLGRVNAEAESQPGFIWRLQDDISDTNNAMSIQAFGDPNIIPNLSLWADIESLAEFAYRNDIHKSIMRRRREWFDKIEFYLVLWWVEAGHLPTVEEAKSRLEYLEKHGSSEQAFTFRFPYPAPDGLPVEPVLDKCA